MFVPISLLISVTILANDTNTVEKHDTQEWAQWGGSPSRNNTPVATDLPTEWDLGKFDFRTAKWLAGPSVKNVKWIAYLGTYTYGSPVIAGGKIFCATNNGAGRLARYPSKIDLGCLLAFDQSSGRFLWQHSAEKLSAGHDIDWPDQGICSTPLVENDRLWVVTNRGEVVCLDTEGFRDDQNDGPFDDEVSTAKDESDVVWKFDMMRSLGSMQHNMASCSVTAWGDLLFVMTSNGVDAHEKTIPAPEAPSFIALDKRSGKLLWADHSPGRNILHGQWGSPAAGMFDGIPQAIFPGGDGWIYSFLAKKSDSGKPVLLWKFDTNPKESVWGGSGRGDRNSIIATPVIDDGLVYIATGQDPESGEGQGDLWCINPTKRGDVSATRVVDRNGRLAPTRRLQAVDSKAGERVVVNPNSAAVWHYRGHDANNNGQFAFEETMHRTLGMVAIQKGLLVLGDYSGLVHCLDAKTGRVYWTYDMLGTMWGSPLIADGKIYFGDEDGDLAVFKLSKEFQLLAENRMENAVYGSPVAVGNVLYIATKRHLVAIEKKP